jgi:hypothetical protein
MPSLPIRQDLRDLFAHCEQLLASAQANGHQPFSQDERKMICYYANQLARLTRAQTVQGNGKPALT